MTYQPEIDTALIREIDEFCAEHGMKPSTFGKAALNDPAFYLNLKNGREVRRATRRKLAEFMAEAKTDAA